MRHPFDIRKAQNPRVAFECMDGAEQGTDLRLGILGRILLKLGEGRFHCIQGLRAVIGVEGPDFVHFICHGVTSVPGVGPILRR